MCEREGNNYRGRNSWASGEVIDGKGESGRSQIRNAGRRRQSKMFMGKKCF